MRTINPVEHIRGHPDLYLPGGRADATLLASRLAGDALLLGAGRVELSHDGCWWWVAADRDWMGVNPSVPVREAFIRVIPFPEAGVNSMRSEILLTAFAEQVVTAADGARECIKGNVADADPAWRVLPSSCWARLVAFRLCRP
jgi:hypothetical protein